jgi:aminoglycoside phosphotransferase (APT) family kinase protein
MKIKLGEPIGSGTRSTVYECGSGRVAKVPFAGTPDAWIRYESTYTAAVRAAGAPAPEAVGVVEIDGRSVGVYEHIVGPSMWDQVVANPASASDVGRDIAELHLSILELSPPATLPRRCDRLAGKLRRAAATIDARLLEAFEVVPFTDAMSLCHGDLHPGNVIVSDRGPVVIDWFDACRGSAVADVARSSLLMGARGATTKTLKHLPGATPQALDDLHSAYLGTMSERLNIDSAEFAQWQRVEAAARLCEVGPNSELMAIWQRG